MAFVSRSQNFKSQEKTLKSPKCGCDLIYVVLIFKGIGRMDKGIELTRTNTLFSYIKNQ